MTQVHVVAKRDFLESLASARPLIALSELIWNGLDAGSDHVEITVIPNDMQGLQEIRVRDHGYGIDHSKVEMLFGSLGESWKKEKERENGRALHGKSGKGRFKVFTLGDRIEWNTTYKRDGKTYYYKITGNFNTIDNFEIADPVETKNDSLGTEVVIYNIKRDFRSLYKNDAPIELAKVFSPYLTEYPNVRIKYNDVDIDSKSVQTNKEDYVLDSIKLENGRTIKTIVSIIEWNIPTDRAYHLCDASGISLHELEVPDKIRAPGFNFTVYIKSDYFREMAKSNQLEMGEMHPDVRIIFNAAKNKIKEHFRQRIVETQGKIVDRWKEEQIYPYEEKSNLTPLEKAERQVFDILAVNVQGLLPSFEDADVKSKKFTFRLLAQAIQENPASVQEIITEVLGLKKEAQDDLAELLKKTPLASIISSAKIVANRLDFLAGLEILLFDKKTKKQLLERDQLHKILENEAWLFHEEFTLAGREERLEEVLQKHLEKLGKREEDPSPVIIGNGKTGRVDLMLHKVIQPRTGEYDYLIVELKRPSKKINADVLQQIQNYAFAVANDERFHGVPAKWTFIVISNELDDYALNMVTQRDRPKWKVYDSDKLNITVWAKPWAEVINEARARLQFYKNQLSYEADRDSAKAYLKKTHAKFIPVEIESNE
ncbi:MAG: hypothetical protein APR54_03160 [Candidatus Cloacimonas sp. SDB]|nr:MAG: hypothetical protein APR54_03160 [Candidatus Cloacimonas sp. SDB]